MGLRKPVRLVLVTVVLGAALVGVASGPASAAPAISLSTSTPADGDTVHVELAGFPGGAPFRAVGLCPVAALEDPVGIDAVSKRCALLALLGTTATSADVVVRDANRVFDGAGAGFVCSTLADGCAIVAADLDLFYVPTAIAWEPIAFSPPPWSLAVTPATVRPWQPTAVTTQGFPAGPAKIGICTAAPAASEDRCAVLGSYPQGMPTEAEVVVPYVFDTASGRNRCDQPCVLAAWVDDGVAPGVPALAYAAVPFTAPAVSVSPSTIADGDAVTVSATGLPAGPASAVQCVGPPTGPSGYGQCVPVASGEVAADGTVTLTGVVSIPTAIGTCGASCWIGVLAGDPSTGFAFAVHVEVSAPSLGGITPGPYWSGTQLFFEFSGFVGGAPTVAQCALPVGVDLASSRCGAAAPTSGGTGSYGYALLTLHRELATTTAGTVSCRTPESCAIVAFRADGRTAVSVPVTFRIEPRILLSATNGLTDGAVVDVSGTDLGPDAQVRILRCLTGATSVVAGCESPSSVPLLTADADGSLQAQATIAQRFTSGDGRHRYCRNDGCSIAVVSAGGTKLAQATYRLSLPTVSASPASDVADGDTITVTGAGLQPTYAGPTVLFPTGGWAVAQCDAAVGTDPSIVKVFQQCAVASGGAAVNVPVSTSATDVLVHGTITKILGGTTDCTESQGACVVGLVRWEQDGTTTSAFTPISFG